MTDNEEFNDMSLEKVDVRIKLDPELLETVEALAVSGDKSRNEYIHEILSVHIFGELHFKRIAAKKMINSGLMGQIRTSGGK